MRAIQASGLTREEYAERMHSRDEAANAVLAEALAALAALQAREEALLRAYEASGKTVAEFADMYGMDPRTAERSPAQRPPTVCRTCTGRSGLRQDAIC